MTMTQGLGVGLGTARARAGHGTAAAALVVTVLAPLAPAVATWQVPGPGVRSAVTVYVIDSGIRATHREFGGRVAPGFSTVADGRGTDDCHGHGTHVAGLIGGDTFGAGRRVRLVPVRVLNCAGRGSIAQIIAGVDWVTKNHKGAAVANISAAGGASPELDAAVARSIDSGVTYVVAAGNRGADACRFSPARLPSAITVGASTAAGRRTGYSDRGPCVDLSARGSVVVSAANTDDHAVEMRSGTSMAAPAVARRVAALLQDHPGATPGVLTSMLLGRLRVDRPVTTAVRPLSKEVDTPAPSTLF